MRGTVKRAEKVTSGGVLNQTLTTSWNDGDSMIVEAATDFSPDGGTAVIEPGHPTKEEVIEYAGILIPASDTAQDRLLGVQRPNKKAHSVGVFIQEGLTPTVEKQVDLLVAGQLFPGVMVDQSVYTYIATGPFDDDLAPVVPVDFNAEGFALVTGPPVGAIPQVGDDPETLPPLDALPPPTGVQPNPVTSLNAVQRLVPLPDGTFAYFIDISYAHDGLYEDGTAITGLHFQVEIDDGVHPPIVFGDVTQTSLTQQAVGDVTYTVTVYAVDFAGTQSDPASDSVTTSPDATPPATPTGLTLLGGAGGGGVGIIYSFWTAPTDEDYSHTEVHASTVSSGFTPSASTMIAATATSNHPISKAYNGTSITTFGYTTTVHVKLIHVDRSGNKSAASSVASSTAAQAASADITDIQSDNYVLGSTGWRLTKAGNFEGNAGTFRGSLTAGTIVSLSTSGGGVVITGSTNSIVLGSNGMTISGSGNGSITFGSGSGSITLSGTGTGAINVGTGITIDGTGAGVITASGGTFRTASSGTRIELSGTHAGDLKFYTSGSLIGRAVATSTFALYGSSTSAAVELGASTVTITGDVTVNTSDSFQALGQVLLGPTQVDGFLVGTLTGDPPTGYARIYKDANNLMAKAPGRAAVVIVAM